MKIHGKLKPTLRAHNPKVYKCRSEEIIKKLRSFNLNNPEFKNMQEVIGNRY